MRADLQLISLLLRSDIDDAVRHDTLSLFTEMTDWASFCRFCQRHGVLALVLQAARLHFPDDLPKGLSDTASPLLFQGITRSMSLTRALMQVLELFSEHSVQVIPFKGPVLAKQLYGDVGLRNFGDLDILIDKGEVKQAIDILVGAGFVPEIHAITNKINRYINQEDNLSFYRVEDHCTVELHWDGAGCYLAEELTKADIDASLQVTVAGRSLPCFCPEDLLVYLCVHGSKHVWERLEWLYSVGCVLEVYPEFDWDLVWKRTTKWQCERMVLVALHLASELFGVHVPEHVLALVKADQQIEILAKQACTVLSARADNQANKKQDLRFSRFHLQIRDTGIDATRYGLRLLFRPTVKEWQVFSLPGWLSFLYYGLRPLRLGWLRLNR